MSFDVSKWHEDRIKARKEQAKSYKLLNKYLKGLGYKYIRVWYEGAGDSGECYHAEGWKSEINLKVTTNGNTWHDHYQTEAWNHNKEENFDKYKNFTRNQVQLQKDYDKFREKHPDLKLQGELHYELVDLVDYDWYNNEGGQGEVLWDLEKENVTVNGEQNVRACNDVTERYFLNGDDPEFGYDSELHEV